MSLSMTKPKIKFSNCCHIPQDTDDVRTEIKYYLWPADVVNYSFRDSIKLLRSIEGKYMHIYYGVTKP